MCSWHMIQSWLAAAHLPHEKKIYIYKCMCIGMDIHMCTYIYIYIYELIVHILEYEGSVLFEVCLKADIELHIGFLELEHGLHLLCNFIEKLFIRTLGLGCNFEVHL